MYRNMPGYGGYIGPSAPAEPRPLYPQPQNPPQLRSPQPMPGSGRVGNFGPGSGLAPAGGQPMRPDLRPPGRKPTPTDYRNFLRPPQRPAPQPMNPVTVGTGGAANRDAFMQKVNQAAMMKRRQNQAASVLGGRRRASAGRGLSRPYQSAEMKAMQQGFKNTSDKLATSSRGMVGGGAGTTAMNGNTVGDVYNKKMNWGG